MTRTPLIHTTNTDMTGTPHIHTLLPRNAVMVEEFSPAGKHNIQLKLELKLDTALLL